MPRALIIVDVQPTFCEGGALPVEGGNACAQRVADFVAAHAADYDCIVTSQDWHIDPGSHFSDHPDFVDTWPPHGVAGTAEAELHPALAALHADVTIHKGMYEAAYSAFDGEDVATKRPLLKLLRDKGIDSLDVVGLAQSHCVCETALDGVKDGFKVRVFTDLTEPVSPELGELAAHRMAEAGVELVPSKD